MVIRPTLEKDQAAAPTRAREGRQVIGTGRRRGLLAKAARVQAARRAIRRVGRVAPARGVMLGRVLGVSAAVAATVALVVARLVSGRSFKGMGAVVNKAVLGDADERALARKLATDQLLANPLVLRVAGTQGITSQIYRLHEAFTQEHLATVRGVSRTLENEAFDVDSTLDLLVLGVIRKIKQMTGRAVDIPTVKGAR
jgi:hypothetical protein